MTSPDAFLADILAEPEALAGLLDAYGGLESPLDGIGDLPERRIVFVGMGSSRFAALAATARLRAAGIDAHAEYASAELPPSTAGTLVVAVSASGSTAETVEAASRIRGAGRLVAVTGDPDSRLAEGADLVLPLLCGEETGGIACRSYQATVAVLLLLCGRITGLTAASTLRPAVGAVTALTAARGEWLAPALEILGGGPLDVVAPAARLSSAEQSALMLREAPRVRAAACETGDWLHVDVYLTRPPGYRALLLPGSPYDPAFAAWMQQRGCAFVTVGRPVAGSAFHIGFPGAEDPDVALLTETTAAELLAAEMWRRACA